MARISSLASVRALGVLQRNEKSFGAQLWKVATGEKLRGAGDGAAEFSISERMRVRLRALAQDSSNVSHGTDLLHVAEGGIQQQIAILKTVRAKVLDAANDDKTDADRKTIQKEIRQSYQALDEIAYHTQYAGIHVLLGSQVIEQGKETTEKLAVPRVIQENLYHYETTDQVTYVDGSDSMQMIPDVYATLDGMQGPFDIFKDWLPVREEDQKNLDRHAVFATVPELGLKRGQQLSQVGEDKDNVYAMDFSGYASVQDLEGVGFFLYQSGNWVFRVDPSKNYRFANVVDVGSCQTVEDAVKVLASKLGSLATLRQGTTLQLDVGQRNEESVDAHSSAAEDFPPRLPASATGLFPSKENFSGGVDATWTDGSSHSDGSDSGSNPGTYTPAVYASLTKNVASVAAGTGITVHAKYDDEPFRGTSTQEIYLQFVDGTAGPSQSTGSETWVVGKNANVSALDLGHNVKLTMKNGVMTLTAGDRGSGADGNAYYVTDGIAEALAEHYDAVSSFFDTGGKTINEKCGSKGIRVYDLDLSAYNSVAGVDALSKLLSDKAFFLRDPDYTATMEFYDSRDPKSLAAVNEFSQKEYARIPTYSPLFDVDMNAVRTAVRGGKNVATALAEVMQKAAWDGWVTMYDGYNKFSQSPEETAEAYEEIRESRKEGIQFTSDAATSTLRLTGDPQYGDAYSFNVLQTRLRSYQLDYGSWFSQHETGEETIPEYLDQKGFRVYCGTCNTQWFNFIFLNGTADRGASGTKDADIKSLVVDVAEVTDAASLVQAIYDQAMPLLTGKDPNFNHYLRLAADDGVLTVYDDRLYALTTLDYPNLQSKGPKIADGIYDNVVLKSVERGEPRTVYDTAFVTHTTAAVEGRRVVIQDTDHANQNIRLGIPKATARAIFGASFSETSEAYSVVSKKGRENLLGTKKAAGALDRGLAYLEDAAVLIGAQHLRMRQAEKNLTIQQENLSAAESVIRDADMAKELTAYAREHLFLQSSQAMLAQANQHEGMVLDLLQ